MSLFKHNELVVKGNMSSCNMAVGKCQRKMSKCNYVLLMLKMCVSTVYLSTV